LSTFYDYDELVVVKVSLCERETPKFSNLESRNSEGETFVVSSVLLFIVSGQVYQYIWVTIERTRKFVNECSHESRGSRFDYHLSVGVNRLTVLVLLSRGDEYRDTFLKILLRDTPERLALRVEIPVRSTSS